MSIRNTTAVRWPVGTVGSRSRDPAQRGDLGRARVRSASKRCNRHFKATIAGSGDISLPSSPPVVEIENRRLGVGQTRGQADQGKYVIAARRA